MSRFILILLAFGSFSLIGCSSGGDTAGMNVAPAANASATSPSATPDQPASVGR